MVRGHRSLSRSFGEIKGLKYFYRDYGNRYVIMVIKIIAHLNNEKWNSNVSFKVVFFF